MASSRTLLAPGLRTAPRGGWRSDLAAALSVVAGQPYLWLLGMIGFNLRGGVLLLIVPIIVLPTQVEVRLLLGGNLGSTGLTAGFWALVGAGVLLAILLATGVLLVLARLELAAFERLASDPEMADDGTWQPAAPLDSPTRRRLLLRLFAVQFLTLLVLGAGAVPLAFGIGQTALDEILRPSSSASIYLRVLAGMRDPLLVFLSALVAVEALSALMSRELLVRAFGRHGAGRTRGLWLLPALGSAIARIIRSPVRTLGTAVIGWTVWVAILLPVGWSIGVAWQAVRAAFLTSVSFSDPEQDVGLVFVALALSAAFVLGMLLAGFGSALRAGFWTVERLR